MQKRQPIVHHVLRAGGGPADREGNKQPSAEPTSGSIPRPGRALSKGSPGEPSVQVLPESQGAGEAQEREVGRSSSRRRWLLGKGDPHHADALGPQSEA